MKKCRKASGSFYGKPALFKILYPLFLLGHFKSAELTAICKEEIKCVCTPYRFSAEEIKRLQNGKVEAKIAEARAKSAKCRARTAVNTCYQFVASQGYYSYGGAGVNKKIKSNSECWKTIAEGDMGASFGSYIKEPCQWIVNQFKGMSTFSINDPTSENAPSKQPCGTGMQSFGVTCVKCKRGYYSNTYDMEPCKRCPFATISTKEGQGACTKCPLGQINNDDNTACVKLARSKNCSPGFYWSGSNCSKCPKGFFKNIAGEQECTACSGKTYSDVEGAKTCKKCSNSRQVTNDDGTGCMFPKPGSFKCPAGKRGGSGLCHDCVPGKYQPTEGYQATCKRCPVGTYSNTRGATKCTPCPRGTWSTRTGSSKCPPGTPPPTTPKPTIKKVCPAGKFADKNAFGKVCTLCYDGFYKPNAGDEKCHLKCGKGMVPSSDRTKCVKGGCPAGKYWTHWGKCYDCKPGLYKPEVGNHDCQKCSLGSEAISKDKSKCECPPGKYLSYGRCYFCKAGTFKTKAGNHNCKACPYGEKQTTNRKYCYKPSCRAGTEWSPEKNGCVMCNSASYKASQGSQKCTVCPTGKIASKNRDSCVYPPCVAGFEFNSATKQCVQCKSGYYKSTVGLQACSKCPAGKVSSDDRDKCTTAPCGPGKYKNKVNDKCYFCPWGSFKSVSGDDKALCRQCPENTQTKRPGYASCETYCSPGMELKNGKCQKCADGFWKSGSGNRACTALTSRQKSSGLVSSEDRKKLVCGAGRYSYGYHRCTWCANGSFKAGRGDDRLLCLPCPKFSQSTPDRSKCEKITCKAGFYYNEKYNKCYGCPNNQYTETEGVPTECKKCKTGYKSNLAKTACVEDKGCNPGTYYDKLYRVCKACPWRKFKSEYGNDKLCQYCPSGSNPTSDKTSCTCPSGQKFDTKSRKCYGGNVTKPPQCAAGKYKSGTRCVPCSTGYYKSTVGNEACKSCGNGKTSNSSKTGCVALTCGAGKYLTYQSCAPCTPGYYKPTVGNTNCLKCPDGKTPNYNKTGCVTLTCSAGRHLVKRFGISSCQLCGNGYYKPTSGNTACLKCADGKLSNSNRTGCESIKECPAGQYFYVNKWNSRYSRCTTCPYGTYAATQGSRSSCTRCATGSVSANDRKSCVKIPTCLAGQYYDKYQNKCKSCRDGYYNPSPSTLTYCKRCGSNQQSNANKTGCETLNCKPGHFLYTYWGRQSCRLCYTNTIKKDSGNHKCTRCPYGKRSNDARTECVDKNYCSAGKYFYRYYCRNCNNGYYKSSAGTQGCTRCPTGKISANDKKSCIDIPECPAGQRYYLSYYGYGRCSPCYSGTYAGSAGRRMNCDKCPTGKVSSSDKKSCVDIPSCNSGHYYNTWSSKCVKCDYYSYKSGSGVATRCTRCSYGMISSKDRTKCIKKPTCPRGYYYNVYSGRCVRSRYRY